MAKKPLVSNNMGLHTWRDYIARAAERLTQGALDGGGDASNYRDSEFSGCDSLKTAVGMATAGWQEGAQAVGRTLDNVTPEQDVLPYWTLEVAGAIPCMPAVMSGELECMWHMADEQRSVRRVALVVPSVYHCGVSAAEVANYGKAVAATARAIEASGMDAAIYALDCTDGHRGLCGVAVSVRAYGEPMDLAKIAFAFHPAFLRRIGFAWRERTKAACDAGIASGGYGYCRTTPTDAHAHEVCGDMGAATVVLPTVSDLHSEGKLRGGDEAVKKLIPLLREKADAAIRAAGGKAS